MSTVINNHLQNNLKRNLFVFEDEQNPYSSQINRIWPQTVLDQVFDDLSPTCKNLREILADLKQEIITGGIGNIIFPITHINGKTGGEIWLTANDLGLGRVDNTRDVDKPLSVPQKTSIMEILQNYNFNQNNINFIKLEQLMEHLLDYNNPHKIKLEDLDPNDMSAFINNLLQAHNVSTLTSTHPDIRRSLTTLWNRVDDIDRGIEERIADSLKIVDNHISDNDPHSILFSKKEDISNRIYNFDINDCDHSHYPTTRAVYDHMTFRFKEWSEQNPASTITEWIGNQQVVSGQSDLPPAEEKYYRKSYLLKRSGSLGIETALAVCRKDTDGSYWWDIAPSGGISLFDPTYFIPKNVGMSIHLPGLLREIYKDGMLKNFYDREEADKRFIRSIHGFRGTTDGTIRLYVNNDMSTISDDIPVAGLQSLAYREWITENEIYDLAVHNRHLLSRSVDARVLQEKLIGPEHIRDDLIKNIESINALSSVPKGNLLGNIMRDDGTVYPINLQQLGDLLRPIIGGWPDVIPNPEGGPGFSIEEIIESLSHILNPEFMTPGIEYKNPDGSALIRFTGTISRIPNQTDIQPLSTELSSNIYHLVDVKGSWCYQSDTQAEAILGGTNHTGHTYAWVNMTKSGINFESLSIGDRKDAFYDITVHYRKK